MPVVVAVPLHVYGPAGSAAEGVHAVEQVCRVYCSPSVPVTSDSLGPGTAGSSVPSVSSVTSYANVTDSTRFPSLVAFGSESTIGRWTVSPGAMSVIV